MWSKYLKKWRKPTLEDRVAQFELASAEAVFNLAQALLSVHERLVKVEALLTPPKPEEVKH